jgi:membrane associated rhomboid family serine protease
MIPLRDTEPTRNYPVVNSIIIATNVLVYIFQLAQGDGSNRIFHIYGLLPARYSEPEIAAYFTTGQQIFSFFSYMFLHGGFWHLLGNMWSLYIFGDNIEDTLGHLRYIFFYVLCGLASGISHVLINWGSGVPTIGASGAIAGVMGAYILLYPRAKILTLIPIFFIPYFVELPAFFFLGIWFVLQFFSATLSQGQGGIAWWAHIGGFIFGLIFLKVFRIIPEWGITRKVRQRTAKKGSHRLRTIKTVAGGGGDSNLYGTITITSKEAETGTRKIVNVPWGFQKRLFAVTVPPGVRNGTRLRLSGIGKKIGNMRGDLYLEVKIAGFG